MLVTERTVSHRLLALILFQYPRTKREKVVRIKCEAIYTTSAHHNLSVMHHYFRVMIAHAKKDIHPPLLSVKRQKNQESPRLARGDLQHPQRKPFERTTHPSTPRHQSPIIHSSHTLRRPWKLHLTGLGTINKRGAHERR